MKNKTSHSICFQCYREQGLEWGKGEWKKACNKKAWKCPSFVKGILFSPFPPPWCEYRAELESIKKSSKSPIQVFVEG